MQVPWKATRRADIQQVCRSVIIPLTTVTSASTSVYLLTRSRLLAARMQQLQQLLETVNALQLGCQAGHAVSLVQSSFLSAQANFRLACRGAFWTDAHRGSGCAGYPSLNDKAAELGAKLDFFGTGLPPGLLSEYRSDSGSDSEDEEDEDDWQAGGHCGRRSGGDITDAEQEAALRALPAGVRARLREQSSRLARLEEENLDLKEVRMSRTLELAHSLNLGELDRRTAGVTCCLLKSSAYPHSSDVWSG